MTSTASTGSARLSIDDWTERALTEVFGVELTGQKIGPELPMAERQAVYDAVTRHGVVVLPGQDLSDEDIDDFAASLGAPIKIPAMADEPPLAVARLRHAAENAHQGGFAGTVRADETKHFALVDVERDRVIGPRNAIALADVQ